jgi:transcriptional regulator with XRE-family HTH domain
MDNPLGNVIKHQRVSLSITLHELAATSGVSASHLGRIERGERFPSAHILKRIAGPLQFEEDELFTLAGYLSPTDAMIAEQTPPYGVNKLDPYVARVLAQEPIEVQRSVIAILSLLKSLAKTMPKENPHKKSVQVNTAATTASLASFASKNITATFLLEIISPEGMFLATVIPSR